MDGADDGDGDDDDGDDDGNACDDVGGDDDNDVVMTAVTIVMVVITRCHVLILILFRSFRAWACVLCRPGEERMSRQAANSCTTAPRMGFCGSTRQLIQCALALGL